MTKRLFFVATIGLFMGLLLKSAFIVPQQLPVDLSYMEKTPVLHNGRIKPLEAVARNTLLNLSDKQQVEWDGKRYRSMEWFFLCVAHPEISDALPIFRLINPNEDVKNFLNLTSNKKVLSYNDLKSSLHPILEQAGLAAGTDSQLQNSFQKEIVALSNKIQLYNQVKYTFFIEGRENLTDTLTFYAEGLKDRLDAFTALHNGTDLPDNQLFLVQQLNNDFHAFQYLDSISLIRPFPSLSDYHNTNYWINSGISLLAMMDGETALHPMLLQYAGMMDAYRAQDYEEFNRLSKDLYLSHKGHAGSALLHTKFEALFLKVQPFYLAMVFYLFTFLVVLTSVFYKQKTLTSVAHFLFTQGLLLHTFGVIGRMIITLRPPVTNLYSSAVFVGWIGILLAYFLKKRFQPVLITAMSTMLAFCTLIIAHHLSLSGDTFEMMQAVLDTNFWLATHVVIITIGYGTAFMAGAIALGAFIKKLFNRLSSQDTVSLAKLTFGMLCFSLLFSFVGTVLGGIWADQSWGRFWGWDPKENGALLIVLWQAITLHARMGKWISNVGVMGMAILGNIVTAYSWFGVNLLGIGLHSYGFTESGFFWLMAFVASQLLVLVLGLFKFRL